MSGTCTIRQGIFCRTSHHSHPYRKKHQSPFPTYQVPRKSSVLIRNRFPENLMLTNPSKRPSSRQNILSKSSSSILINRYNPISSQATSKRQSLPIKVSPLPNHITIKNHLLITLRTITCKHQCHPSPHPNIIFLPKLHLKRLGRTHTLNLHLKRSQRKLMVILRHIIRSVLFPRPRLSSFPIHLM